MDKISQKSKKFSFSALQKDWRFWVAFWLVATILLFSWYVFLQVKYRNIENLKPVAKVLPVSSERKNEILTLAGIYQKMAGSDEEKNFLVLFQNDMELRPGGGFIGSFGVVKTKAGKIVDIQVIDTGRFDQQIPATETPPYALSQYLKRQSWKMRDSNWSPDFSENARNAEYFYHLGGGEENFEGVIAINTDILNSILSITGPVKIDDYPGIYNDQTAILQLEYQVEKGFYEQGIEKSDRKSIMKDLAEILIDKIHNFNLSEQLELAKIMEKHLNQKDIQIYFKDEELQTEIENIGWGGRIDDFDGDYLMTVDANLNSLKSDHCIEREMKYKADMSSDIPRAELEITYSHTCRTKDWMTTDYRDWLRVYAPEGSFLTEAEGNKDEVRYSNDLGKKVFGMMIFVPVGETKTVTLKYNLPKEIKENPYQILVQKQSGSGEIPFEITVIQKDGEEAYVKEVLNKDTEISF